MFTIHAQPDPELEIEPEPEPEPEQEVILDQIAMSEAPIALAIAPESGPDPQTLATLARLERFLAAVETARHA